MLEILLIRHGQTDWNLNRRIMGRRRVPLNRYGRSQACQVALALKGLPLDAVYSSPVSRAVQTARFLLRGRRGKLLLAPEMAEIDYGHWVGKTFDEVRGEKGFILYHTRPRLMRVPGGEKMMDMRERSVGFIERLRTRHASGRVVVVSHADVIKTVLLNYLKLDLNKLLRLRIDHCSISVLIFDGKRERVLAVNCPPDLRYLFQ